MPITWRNAKGLQKAIEEAGHWARMEDGVFVTSNDKAVQIIIDSFNPWTEQKNIAIRRINKEAQKAFDASEKEYPDFEKQTFEYQKKEIQAYDSDNKSQTPNIDKMAARRGITKEKMIDRVRNKLNRFENKVFDYIGEKQRLVDQINNTVEDGDNTAVLDSIKFIPPS